jgi:hypothetical protein
MSIECQNLTTRHTHDTHNTCYTRHDTRDTYHDAEKGSAEIKIIHVKTLELCAGLKSLILQVCKHKQRKSVLSKDDVDRLKYLYETVHLINFYVSSQSQENRKFRCASILVFVVFVFPSIFFVFIFAFAFVLLRVADSSMVMAVGGTHRAYSLLLFPLYDALLQTHKMVSDIYRYRHHPCVRVVSCRVCRVS